MRRVTNVAVAPGGLKMTRMRACDARSPRVWRRTGRFNRSWLPAGVDPGGFAQVFIGYA